MNELTQKELGAIAFFEGVNNSKNCSRKLRKLAYWAGKKVTLETVSSKSTFYQFFGKLYA